MEADSPGRFRRLLYRYFYELDSAADSPARTSPGGTEAHVEARRFMKNWAENQVGADQVVGMVELPLA